LPRNTAAEVRHTLDYSHVLAMSLTVDGYMMVVVVVVVTTTTTTTMPNIGGLSHRQVWQGGF